jgi:nicotinate-nucleotide pyrophosphorylase (carboxylating)
MKLAPLPDTLIEPLVRAALDEDLGGIGDITTDAIVPPERLWKGALVARRPGIVAGIDLARMAFRLIDPSIAFDGRIADGSAVKPGDSIALVHGLAAAILTAERVALNFLCHLSGIATATQALVEAAKPHKAHICDTRKTTPTLRRLEKYAVLAGGGFNHRFGLYDAMLIKDNHIVIAGGVRAAVLKAREAMGPSVKMEVEIDTLDQLRDVLDLPIDIVLLDNMDAATLKEAVKLVDGRFITEASGGVTLKNVNAIAATGVDRISVGAITHSAGILDIGLDELPR